MGEQAKLNCAQRTLVLEHCDYAKKLAWQFYRERQSKGFEFEDVEGAALLGLCDAARRFDLNKGKHFYTFAYFRIRGAMYDLLRYGGGIAKRQFNRLIENNIPQSEKTQERPTKDALSAESLPYAFASTIAELVSLADSIDVMNLKIHPGVGDTPTDLSYQNALSPEQLTAIRAMKRQVRYFIDLLPEDQQKMIELRYFADASIEQLQKEFDGASKSYLSRVHTRALDNLRALILSHAKSTKQAKETLLEI